MFDFFPFSRLSYVWETTSLHSHVSLGKTQELHRLRRKVMPNACDMENPIQMNYQNRAWHFNKGEKEQSGGKNKPEPLRMEFDKRGTNSNSTESCVNKLLTSLFGLTRCSKTNKKKNPGRRIWECCFNGVTFERAESTQTAAHSLMNSSGLFPAGRADAERRSVFSYLLLFFCSD